mgnify:FL=1|jgi:hypothetical protein
MIFGTMLVFMGILMPALLNTENMMIYSDLNNALKTDKIQYVIIAAFKLVLLNGLRGLPHYLGVFILGESFSVRYRGKKIRFVKTIMICGLIPLVYLMIEMIYHIHYDFGIPAILIIIFLMGLEKIDFNMIDIYKKALLFGMTVITFQWLDVLPSLSGLAFGRGETSYDIKNIALLLGESSFLETSGLVFFLLFLFSDILIFKLILDENNLRTISEENRKNQEILMEKNIQILENRTYLELIHLVHDLKSPLTSVQALVGVIKLGAENEKEIAYIDKIESSIDRMSSMISEILYEDKKSPIYVDEISNFILSQISNSEYSNLVTINITEPNLIINVNKIRLSRAIINILENSYHAIDISNGYINISVSKIFKDDLIYALFEVEDNGSGISKKQIDNIWISGYSTRNSLGFGLDFVKKVINDNNGYINIDSVEGQGTTVYVYLPAEYQDNEKV